MIKRTLRSDAGFTYIAALVMVVVMGIMLGKAAVVWTTQMKRERETELLFRGAAIRYAIRVWYYGPAAASQTAQVQPGQPVPQPQQQGANLMELKDLLKDPSKSTTVRYLRPSMLIDPITRKEWGVIRVGGAIVGVKSTSEAEPLKKGNFPDDFTDFEGKPKYSDWEFIYNKVPQRIGSAGGVNLPGSTTPQPQPPQ